MLSNSDKRHNGRLNFLERLCRKKVEEEIIVLKKMKIITLKLLPIYPGRTQGPIQVLKVKTKINWKCTKLCEQKLEHQNLYNFNSCR